MTNTEAEKSVVFNTPYGYQLKLISLKENFEHAKIENSFIYLGLHAPPLIIHTHTHIKTRAPFFNLTFVHLYIPVIFSFTKV